MNALNITVRRGGKILLNAVSHAFPAGKLSVVLGPNGAGKSTLLRVLASEWIADEGRVLWRDRDISELNERELARRRAFLHQETHLDFSFKVEEVVMLGRFPHGGGVETPEDAEIVDSALRRLDLNGLADRDYTTLSGGEKQRVQVARSLTQVWNLPVDGGYWLLDEPVNNLDPAHQRATLQLLREWAGKGWNVIAVLHDLNLAMEFADEALLLKQGNLLASGRVEEVLTADYLRAAFDLEMICLRLPGRTKPVILAAEEPVH